MTVKKVYQQLQGFDGIGFPEIEVETNFRTCGNKILRWLRRAQSCDFESGRDLYASVENVYRCVTEAEVALKPVLEIYLKQFVYVLEKDCALELLKFLRVHLVRNAQVVNYRICSLLLGLTGRFHSDKIPHKNGIILSLVHAKRSLRRLLRAGKLFEHTLKLVAILPLEIETEARELDCVYYGELLTVKSRDIKSLGLANIVPEYQEMVSYSDCDESSLDAEISSTRAIFHLCIIALAWLLEKNVCFWLGSFLLVALLLFLQS